MLRAQNVGQGTHRRDDTDRHGDWAWATHRLRARNHDKDDEGDHRWQPYESHHHAEPEQDIVPKPCSVLRGQPRDQQPD